MKLYYCDFSLNFYTSQYRSVDIQILHVMVQCFLIKIRTHVYIGLAQAIQPYCDLFCVVAASGFIYIQPQGYEEPKGE